MTDKKQKEIILKEEYSIVDNKIKEIFSQKTPKEYIKKRAGRGGKQFDYVEVGYVIKKLNEIFGPFWKFEIVDKGKDSDDIWALGRLTVYFSKDFFISKEQYGSAKIKKDQSGKPLSIGDDYKAAASDALKKCASMFGIAHDVYFKYDESIDEDNNPTITMEMVKEAVARAKPDELMISQNQKNALKNLIERGVYPKELEEHLEDLTYSQAVEVIKLQYQK